jgi:hypothetical protein
MNYKDLVPYKCYEAYSIDEFLYSFVFICKNNDDSMKIMIIDHKWKEDYYYGYINDWELRLNNIIEIDHYSEPVDNSDGKYDEAIRLAKFLTL